VISPLCSSILPCIAFRRVRSIDYSVAIPATRLVSTAFM